MKVSLNKFHFLFLFFLVCFPISFIYEYSYVSGFLPKLPLLGYAILKHVFLPGVFFYSLSLFPIFMVSKYYTAFILYVSYIILVVFLNGIFSGQVYTIGATYQALWSIAYIYAFVIMVVNIEKTTLVSTLFLFLFLLIYLVIALTHLEFNTTIWFSLDRIAGTSEGHINYQRVSFIFLVTWFFFYYSEYLKPLKIFSIFLIAFLLLASGGRSELFGFIFAFSYMALLNSRASVFKTTLWVFIVIVLLVYLLGSSDVYDSISKSRHFEVTDLSESSSWQAREHLKQENLKFILENPLFGNFGSHFKFGEGDYIHNIISVWQQYGILGFILHLILVFTPFIHLSYIKFFSKARNNIDGVLFFSAYVLLLALFTKPVFWDGLGISIGLYISFLVKGKYSISKKPDRLPLYEK